MRKKTPKSSREREETEGIRHNAKGQGERDGKEDRRIERGCRSAGEVVGTIAVTTLVAWYTLLAVHTHAPSPCLPRVPLSLSVFVCRPRSLDSFCTYVRFLPVQTPCNARVHTRKRIHAARSRVRMCACSLASLFPASSLASRRREPHVLSSYSRLRLSTARESTHRDRAIY